MTAQPIAVAEYPSMKDIVSNGLSALDRECAIEKPYEAVGSRNPSAGRHYEISGNRSSRIDGAAETSRASAIKRWRALA